MNQIITLPVSKLILNENTPERKLRVEHYLIPYYQRGYRWEIENAVRTIIEAEQIKLDKVRNFLLSQNGVNDIHDLHVWAMSTTQIALTAHLIMPEGFNDEFISELQKKLEHEFGIGHTTFQIENERIEKECKTDC